MTQLAVTKVYPEAPKDQPVVDNIDVMWHPMESGEWAAEGYFSLTWEELLDQRGPVQIMKKYELREYNTPCVSDDSNYYAFWTGEEWVEFQIDNNKMKVLRSGYLATREIDNYYMKETND